MIVSSSKHQPFVIDLDFIQDELRKQDEKKQKAEDARKAALAPKITDAHVSTARQEGHAQGLKEGHENGKQEASRIYEAHIASIQAKLDDMLSIKDTYKAIIESHTLNLLQNILPPIIGEALEKDISPLIMHHVQKLQSAITEETRLTMRLNRASREVLEGMVAEKQIQLHKDLHIETDDTLTEGDITLHWGNQGVEALVKHSMNHAKEALASAEATHVPETDKLEQVDAPVSKEKISAAPVKDAAESSPLPEDYFEVQTDTPKEDKTSEERETAAPQSES